MNKFRLSNTNISIALGLLACVVAVAFRLFSEADLWFQMFSAILGVIITIIITNLLLNSQSRSDIEWERNSEIFRRELYAEHPNFNPSDINAAIDNFEYAYGYFRRSCQVPAK